AWTVDAVKSDRVAAPGPSSPPDLWAGLPTPLEIVRRDRYFASSLVPTGRRPLVFHHHPKNRAIARKTTPAVTTTATQCQVGGLAASDVCLSTEAEVTNS